MLEAASVLVAFYAGCEQLWAARCADTEAQTYLCHDDGECWDTEGTKCGNVKEDCGVYGPCAITSARNLDRDQGEQHTSRITPPSLLPTHSSRPDRHIALFELRAPGVYQFTLSNTSPASPQSNGRGNTIDIHHNTPSPRLSTEPAPLPKPKTGPDPHTTTWTMSAPA